MTTALRTVDLLILQLLKEIQMDLTALNDKVTALEGKVDELTATNETLVKEQGETKASVQAEIVVMNAVKEALEDLRASLPTDQQSAIDAIVARLGGSVDKLTAVNDSLKSSAADIDADQQALDAAAARNTP